MPQRSSSLKLASTLAVVAAAAWATAVVAASLVTDLPNADGRFASFSRLQVLKYVLTTGEIALSPLDYAQPGLNSGWQYLPQRWIHLQTAVCLWLAALLPGVALSGFLTRSVRLSRAERVVLAAAAGISVLSLWTLGCGLAGLLHSPWLLYLPAMVAVIAILIRRFRRGVTVPAAADVSCDSTAPRTPGWLTGMLLLATVPFAWHLLLGSMSPSTDFDVREYHLQGPREWFNAGQISSLRHNVYTSFPFLSEMVSLAAMVWRQDVRDGAPGGKLTLAGLQLFSALAVFATARRLTGATTGLIAALAFLSTPWVSRISIIAYAEGALTFYVIATSLVLLILWQQVSRPALRTLVLTGLLAGSAMASKYTGLVYVVAPAAATAISMSWFFGRPPGESIRARCHAVFRGLLAFAAGLVIAVGPWLAKNWVLEGNPVYPLAYTVFGAEDWSPAMEAKWQQAHSPDDHQLSRVPEHLFGVIIRNDWQNGFLFAFAVPAMLLFMRRADGKLVACWSLWILFAWWALTHRIDRFWVPVLPLIAVLAGAAWTAHKSRLWRGFVLTCLMLTCLTNYAFSRTDLIGFHAGLIDLNVARRAAVRADFRFLNSVLPQSAKVLMVGEAEVFNAEFRLVYNTVFDDNLFETWTADNSDSAAPAARRFRAAADIRRTFRENRITHVYVNWSEVLRYRLTYGFTEFVHPARFQRLQQLKILAEPRVISSGKWSDRSDREQNEILSWPGGASLRQDDRWDVIQLYRVVDAALPQDG